MNDYYVVLTGAIDNAGDFLIRDRAIRLLQRFRPDRQVYEFSRREAFTEERLEIVNGAKALLLAGGPSVQKNLYPGVFPLTANLEDITVPIILYGAGWKGGGGSWRHENAYALTDSSRSLLGRIASDGNLQSVRDHHTHRLLARHGVEHVTVTGCPALYGPYAAGADSPVFHCPREIEKIALSTGVKFVTDERLEHQFLELLHALAKRFPKSEQTVVVHHSIDLTKLKSAYGFNRETFSQKHRKLVSRIQNESAAECAFVGGGLDDMTTVYDGVDLHIGYRVHAHIYMNSIGKPTYLLAEDGRGVSMGQLAGPERTFVAVESAVGRKNMLARRFSSSSSYELNDRAIEQLVSMLNSEVDNDWYISRRAVSQTETQFQVMKSFISKLP